MTAIVVIDVVGNVSIGAPRHRPGGDPMTALSGAAAIAGIGATEFSKESGRSELQLSVEATLAALADCGLTPADVDGLTTFTMDSSSEIALARELGIGDLRFFSRINYGGGAACATVQQAAMAVATGRRRRRGLLPRLQRAVRPAVRPGLSCRRHPGQHQRPRQRLELPAGARRRRPRRWRCRPGATCTSTAPPPRTSGGSPWPTAGTPRPTRTRSSTGGRSRSRTTRRPG